MKFGLALSGGGLRATVFHLGVMARLAEEKRLEEVTFLSTVSGGSLCVGLVHALNEFHWPTSDIYLNQVVPKARQVLTTQDLQKNLIWRMLRWPWSFFDTRADDLSRLMQQRWGVTAKLSDLPEQPRWMINATCAESGKNWRFERFRMGDYLFGYTNQTSQVPLSDAMAASAGFPGLIGPLVLDATRFKWYQYRSRTTAARVSLDPQIQAEARTEPAPPAFPVAHLWDGGVYDNHGLEGLHDFTKGWRENVEFLIVSDGAGRGKPEKYQAGVKALLRIATGIMMDQVRSLRSRAILERLINHSDLDRGSFLQIGNTCHYVLKNANREAEIPALCTTCLDDDKVKMAESFPTVIRKLTQDEFEVLFRHGFEVADYTLYAYNEDLFRFIGYGNSRWGKPED